MSNSTDSLMVMFIVLCVAIVIEVLVMAFITSTAVAAAREKGYDFYWRLWFVGIFTLGIGACIMVAILPDRKCRNRYVAIRELKGRY